MSNLCCRVATAKLECTEHLSEKYKVSTVNILTLTTTIVMLPLTTMKARSSVTIVVTTTARVYHQNTFAGKNNSKHGDDVDDADNGGDDNDVVTMIKIMVMVIIDVDGNSNNPFSAIQGKSSIVTEHYLNERKKQCNTARDGTSQFKNNVVHI